MKEYVVEMFPYPSGKLHVGHLRNYVFGDVLFRFKNMHINSQVVHAIGWDAFGLPAENAAQLNNMKTMLWISQCINKMRAELQWLHCNYDSDKELNTSHVSYFRITQQIFLHMLNKGIIYKGFSFVNWDPVDETVLAKEQVIDGKGWRSGARVYQKLMSCYYFRLTKYASRLYNGLNDTNWSGSLCKVQKNWLFKHNGYVFKMQIKGTDKYIEIFTKHICHLGACFCCVLAYNHYLAIQFLIKNNIHFKHDDEKHMLLTDIIVINPWNQQEVKVYISDFVLDSFGTSAMYCSVYDDLDVSLLQHNNIDFDSNDFYVVEDDTVVYNALLKVNAIKYTSCYSIHDWCLSRQRVWGCPIPLAYCNNCGTIECIDNDISVQRLNFSNYNDLLLANLTVKCYKCGQTAKVETETLDTFFDSSWYYLKYINDDIKTALKQLPIDYYIGGMEHANLHLIYTRAFIMALSDIHSVQYTEPFRNIIHQGIILHESYMHKDKYVYKQEYEIHKHEKDYKVLPPSKMSKSKLNVVCVEHLQQYCSSTLRVFILSNYPIEQTYTWDDKLLRVTQVFIKRVTTYLETILHIQSHFSIDICDTQLCKLLNDGIRMYKNLKIHKVIATIHMCMKYFRQYKDNEQKMAEWFNVMLVLIYPIMPEVANKYCYIKYKFYMHNAKILHK